MKLTKETVVVMVPREQKEYVIHLDENEAQILYRVLMGVGGIPEYGHPRAVMEDLKDSLINAGVDWKESDHKYDISGSVYINRV